MQPHPRTEPARKVDSILQNNALFKIKLKAKPPLCLSGWFWVLPPPPHTHMRTCPRLSATRLRSSRSARLSASSSAASALAACGGGDN